MLPPIRVNPNLLDPKRVGAGALPQPSSPGAGVAEFGAGLGLLGALLGAGAGAAFKSSPAMGAALGAGAGAIGGGVWGYFRGKNPTVRVAPGGNYTVSVSGSGLVNIVTPPGATSAMLTTLPNGAGPSGVQLNSGGVSGPNGSLLNPGVANVIAVQWTDAQSIGQNASVTINA